MPIELLLFYVFAGLAVFGALSMLLFVRHAVASAMSLLVTVVSLAGIHLLLEAHLVAVLQLIVFAGAILVLFLFVIMLLDLRDDDFGPYDPVQVLVKIGGVAAALVLGVTIAGAVSGTLPAPTELPEGFGGFRDVGLQLFTVYLIPVETAGLLLLAAIVGAAILARRRTD
jgi:NADH-quinone oxidoreductase subunit J